MNPRRARVSCTTAGNADAIRALAAERELGAAVAEAVARAVGFRTVLVHGDAEVDGQQVFENLGRPDDLAAFVSAVADRQPAPR